MYYTRVSLHAPGVTHKLRLGLLNAVKNRLLVLVQSSQELFITIKFQLKIHSGAHLSTALHFLLAAL